DQKLAVALVEMTRPSQIVVNEADVLTVEREVLEALITAVGDSDDGVRPARVDPNAVRAIEFAGFLAFAAPGPHVFRFGVVLVDPTQAVAVRNVDVAVGRHGDVGWLILVFSFVSGAFVWVSQDP